MKIKGSKRIPDNIREQVKILTVEGLSERTIAKRLGISNNAVHRIKKEVDNLEQLRADKKRKMAEELWNLAMRMKSHITDEKLRNTAATSLMISLATAIDKALLLLGEATDRFEVKTDAELNQELKQLEAAEKELKEAWERAKRKKAAEELEKNSTE